MTVITFEWDDSGADVQADCTDHFRVGDRPPDLTYFDFERPVALKVDGLNLFARADGSWMVLTLVHAAGGFEYALAKCRELGAYEFEIFEQGNPKVRMSLVDNGLTLAREDLGITVQVATEPFYAAHADFVQKVRSYLLAHCDRLKQDYYWGYWFREEPRETDR